MIPILYSNDDVTFTSNGLGRLADCTRCEVTEERNGIYICEFDIPVTSQMYKLIQEGRCIGAIHDDKHDIQPFVIYGRTAPIDGLVTFYAHHLSYKLRNVILRPFSASSCAQALSLMETQTYNENPFSFWTDKSVNGTFENKVPVSCRSMLAGQQGSILDVYGTGEYEYDKWEVKLHLHRGNDNGVSIRYGVNLLAIDQDKDISNSFSAVAPYWESDDGTVVMLPEGYIVSPNVVAELFPWTTETDEYIVDQNGDIIEFSSPNIVIAPLDMSSDFESQPTVAQLRTAAYAYLANNRPWLPDDSITVSFVDMAHTEDYKDIAALQRVSLCDYVNVYCGPLGVDAVSMEVVKTVYNVLTETYNEIELGKARATYADTIIQTVDKQSGNYVDSNDLESAIEHSTQLITGGLGGYVVLNLNADGQPNEILIMDTPDKQTAVNVWRFNAGGLGHSHNGYNGPFNDVALTADGKINATMITTGVMIATLIKAGVLKAANGNQNNYWNMETGEFSLKTDGATNGITYKNGVLHINANNIDVGELTANIIKAGILQDGTGNNSWNLVTGALRLLGSFSCTAVIDNDTYRLQMADDKLSFYVNNIYQGYIGFDDNTGLGFHAVSAPTVVLDATTTNAQGEITGGSLIRAYKNGRIELVGTSITIADAASLPVYTYTGTINVVRDVEVDETADYVTRVTPLYGSITVKNGFITSWTNN